LPPEFVIRIYPVLVSEGETVKLVAAITGIALIQRQFYIKKFELESKL